MAPLIALLRLEPNGHMGAQVTAVGCLVAPTHYSSKHNLCTYMLHHDSTAKALFAAFCPHNLSPDLAAPSWESNVTGSVAVCCYATEVISDYGAVCWDSALPCLTSTPKGAWVGLRDNSFECPTNAVFQGLGQMSSQGCTGHAPSLYWLQSRCVVSHGLFVGAVVCRTLLAPLSNAPPQIAVI